MAEKLLHDEKVVSLRVHRRREAMAARMERPPVRKHRTGQLRYPFWAQVPILAARKQPRAVLLLESTTKSRCEIVWQRNDPLHPAFAVDDEAGSLARVDQIVPVHLANLGTSKPDLAPESQNQPRSVIRETHGGLPHWPRQGTWHAHHPLHHRKLGGRIGQSVCLRPPAEE
nr:hypothetical protein [Acidipropionibacterium timonense]